MFISKEDFELSLPVGISAHDEVYESVVPAIELSLHNYCSMLLGDVGTQLVESPDNTPLKQYFKQLVCIAGFLSVLRQLDLVLTSTGFGIVSTDTVSPASKQRVDALEGSLRTALCRARAKVVDLLRSPEWGKGAEARNFIRYLYSEHFFFFSPKASAALSYQDWQAVQSAIVDTDEQLRLRFGDALMDDVLDAYRCADRKRMADYCLFCQLVCDITDLYSSRSKAAFHSSLYRRLERLVDSDPDVFALYHGSDAYKAAHVEPFTNTKESTAFLFNG